MTSAGNSATGNTLNGITNGAPNSIPSGRVGGTRQPTNESASGYLAPVEQSRRGRGSVNSGQGERIVDLVLGSGLVLGGIAQLARGHWLRGGALVLGGGSLTYAGVTGHFKPYASLALVRAQQNSASGLVIEHAVTIDRPREDVYALWRNPSRLPSYMGHLQDVTAGIGATANAPAGTTGRRSRWVATGPLGLKAVWEAEVTADRPGELIAWQSLPGTRVPNSGEVHFVDAPGNRGTEVHVRLVYQPPLGTFGAVIARMFQEEPYQEVRHDLRQLKALLETGEAPTVQGQPHGQPLPGLAGQWRRLRTRLGLP